MLLPYFVLFVGLCNFALARNRARNNDDSDRIVFPGPMKVASRMNSESDSPLDIARQLNEIRTQDDIFRMFPPQDDLAGFADRFGGVASKIQLDKKVINMPPIAVCEPELQLVRIKENPEPSAIYFPQCTRLKRCGGCCNSELLSCQPTEVKVKNYEIRVIKMSKSKKRAYEHATEKVSLMEHAACECRCRIQQKDCTSKHYYDSAGCSCLCRNDEDEKRCNQQYETKHWNNTTCACNCRRVEECSTNFYFNEERCKCERGWPA